MCDTGDGRPSIAGERGHGHTQGKSQETRWGCGKCTAQPTTVPLRGEWKECTARGWWDTLYSCGEVRAVLVLMDQGRSSFEVRGAAQGEWATQRYLNLSNVGQKWPMCCGGWLTPRPSGLRPCLRRSSRRRSRRPRLRFRRPRRPSRAIAPSGRPSCARRAAPPRAPRRWPASGATAANGARRAARGGAKPPRVAPHGRSAASRSSRPILGHPRRRAERTSPTRRWPTRTSRCEWNCGRRGTWPVRRAC